MVTRFHQVACTQLNRARIVERDKISLHILVTPVHQHHRLAVKRGFGRSARILPQRIQDQALNLVSGQRFNRLAFAPAVIAQVEKHQQIAGFLAGFFSAAQHCH